MHVDDDKDGHAQPGGIAETLEQGVVGWILAIREKNFPVPLDFERYFWMFQNDVFQLSAIVTPIRSNLK